MNDKCDVIQKGEMTHNNFSCCTLWNFSLQHREEFTGNRFIKRR